MSGTNKTRKGAVRMRPMSKNSKIINPNRDVPKGASHMRDKATINRLAMYKQKAIHDRDGKFITGQYMSRTPDERIKRIEPNRKWFGNTRTVGQRDLENFRDEMEKHVNDPYTVVMRNSKLPLGLLGDAYKGSKMDLLSTESFKDTFGKKSVRKKPRLDAQHSSVENLVATADGKQDDYNIEEDKNLKIKDKKIQGQELFERGQSRRIWQELYKVIDSADVLVQVLDVRDPMGTRCKRIEDELKTRDRRHKHLVLVLNKCDLVPTWVTTRWVRTLSKEYPTLAFHASITNPFGKGSLIQLLRQFATLHSDKKQISVGFCGYPNVGKSSVINTLKKKKVCNTAPIPGETRVWKYITLFKRVYLIDCPGVVMGNSDSPEETVLKGVVRIDSLENPEDFIDDILKRVKKDYIFNSYGIVTWASTLDFMEQFCRKTGKLHKGGEPDIHNAARMILFDWQRGRLPYFVPPPYDPTDKYNAVQPDGSDGKMSIDQIFTKINVKSQFIPEDMNEPAEASKGSKPEKPEKTTKKTAKKRKITEEPEEQPEEQAEEQAEEKVEEEEEDAFEPMAEGASAGDMYSALLEKASKKRKRPPAESALAVALAAAAASEEPAEEPAEEPMEEAEEEAAEAVAPGAYKATTKKKKRQKNSLKTQKSSQKSASKSSLSRKKTSLKKKKASE